MSFIKFHYFAYLNIILGLLLVLVPVIIEKQISTAVIGITIIGILQVAISILTKETKLPLPKIIDTRLYTLVIFLLSIFLNFTPYILKFTTVSGLLWLVLVSSGISLISILFTNFNFLESK